MSKLEQVLILDPPSELTFRGPFTNVVSTELKLQNPTSKSVLFKVKTTVPKRYCVRPNSGIIEPNGSCIISVMLQPFDFDPSEKTKHKFMVQAMFSPESVANGSDIPATQLETYWKEAKPEQLMDSKLKCCFVQDSGSKAIGDTVENVPSVGPDKPVNTGASDKEGNNSAKEQIDNLRNEINRLKKENEKLKEEESNLRRRAVSSSITSTNINRLSSQHMKQAQEPNFDIKSLILLIAALLVGIIIAKVIF